MHVKDFLRWCGFPEVETTQNSSTWQSEVNGLTAQITAFQTEVAGFKEKVDGLEGCVETLKGVVKKSNVNVAIVAGIGAILGALATFFFRAIDISKLVDAI